MNHLEKPAFRVSVQSTDAQEKVSSLLLSKNWSKSGITSTKLVFEPYYFFSFYIHETVNGKTKVVASGERAFNARTKELDKKLVAMHENEQRQDASEATGAEVLNGKISEEEAKKVLPILLASENSALKDNVNISGLQFVYVPVWHANVHLDGKTVELALNATTAEFLNPEDLPMREKTKNELVAEVLHELSDPSEWLRYASEAVSDFSGTLKRVPITGGPKSHGENHSVKRGKVSSPQGFNLSDPQVKTLVLGIIALLAMIWYLYFR